MTDHRLVMTLLLQGHSYREVEGLAACSHRGISRARRVIEEQGFTAVGQVEALSATELEELFPDGRKSVADQFVPIDVGAVVSARLGRKKPPLKVLWAQYLRTDASGGLRHYGYDRFCELVADHVRTRDLTSPIRHVPGHTLQVDWAGTKMQVVDPISGVITKVSVFVGTWPYSGLVFARGYADERQASWLDAHQKAFEHAGGVPLLVVPDNASTASNQINKNVRARAVNPAYKDFLAFHNTAAVPTRAGAPRDKGSVEAGVKVVTNWVIHYLSDQVFTSLEDLNEAVEARVEWINQKTPFRNENHSRWEWFKTREQSELLELPERRWQPVTWRKAKVHRDWHIQIDTVKYSVPHEYAGLGVDVRIIGDQLDVLTEDRIIATHEKGERRGQYVTNLSHAPAYEGETTGLWTRAYFLRQATKVGPNSVTACERLLDSKPIEAQGFRPCMNILELGKRGNRQILEQARQHLVGSHPKKRVSYTAVKNAMAAIRAEQNQRPKSSNPPNKGHPQEAGGPPQGRDTSSAHFEGPAAFTLQALTQTNTTAQTAVKGGVN